MKLKTLAVMYRQGMLLAAALSLIPAATLWATTEEALPPPRPSIPIVQTSYGKLPLSFEANHGQWDPAVRFVTRGGGHTLFLTPREAVLTLQTSETKADRRADPATQHKPLNNSAPSPYSAVRMRFEGADSQSEMVGLEPLPGIVNYFIGNDPTKWRTNIPTYQKVEYKNLYAGIDLVYYGNQGRLEYDLVVAPGADPTQIMLAFDGAEQLVLDEQGDLVMTLPQSSTATAAGTATIRLQKPVVYQRDEQGEKHLLTGTYVLQAATDQKAVSLHYSHETQHVAFQIASYDTSKPLIIDPVLSWATYLGGSGQDGAGRIGLDASGNVYVAGGTLSSDFPVTTGSPSQSTYGVGPDAFVTKLNAAGTAILYSTYLGGLGEDEGGPIAVDAAGNAYLTGQTNSSNFPITAGSLQGTLGDGYDAFVTKLNPEGTAIIYSTYLGGSTVERGNAIAVDVAGNAYVTGDTGSTDFPGAADSPIQSTLNGPDSFVTKLNAAGTAIVYSTYLGGNSNDQSFGITVDAAGNAYVTGETSSSDFPGTAGSSIQSIYGGSKSGNSDGFVTKINAAGTALVYSTYLGGSGVDFGMDIAVDTLGHAYVTGQTRSSDFPGTTRNPIQSTFGGVWDAFVVKLNIDGTAILYSTYLGGRSSDRGTGIAVDTAGNAYVSGATGSFDFPVTANSAIQTTLRAGGYDLFVTKLNAAGTTTVYSTYLGGLGIDDGARIAVDAEGHAYVTGVTRSPDFPATANSRIQSTNGGNLDAFVAKITSTSVVNDLVTLVAVPSTYRTTADPTGCPAGFVGKFGFDAQLTSQSSSPPLSDLAVKVTTLSNGNLLHNADGGNGGVGSILTVPKTSGYADGTLSPGESVEVNFSLCLKATTPFTFFVDVLGVH